MGMHKDRLSPKRRSADVAGCPKSHLTPDSRCRVGNELVTLSNPPATVKLARLGNESSVWNFTLKSTRSQCVHSVEGCVYTEIFKEYYLSW